MPNRNLFLPISCATLLLLSPSRASQADPAAAAAPTTSPATTTGSTAVAAPASAPAPKPQITYTVVKGDTLTSIAQKFNTTRKKLEKLNTLASGKVKPGQVLVIGPARGAKTKTATTTAKKKSHHTYLVAQPVQDFDIPASTFGSCPVPLPSPEDDTADSPASTSNGKAAPVAQLVSPAELAADEARQERQAEAQSAARSTAAPHALPVERAPQVAATAPAPSAVRTSSLASSKSFSAFIPPTSRMSIRGIRPTANPLGPTPAGDDWGTRFIQQARLLGDQGIDYDDDWRPPGESRAWAMDCSNTTRYLYKVTAGISLPRTASDQYYYLHLQGKAWDVPVTAGGWADTEYLRHNLKPGDLLFWENTYRPERQPPITHVMIFLGTNERGQWIMAGSQSSRGGEHNRRDGGPDIYVFRPTQPCGGYTTWLGLVHHKGRFCAFGRPLEADQAKLSMAEND